MLRRLQIDHGEIVRPHQIPIDAVATGRVSDMGYPEYIYGDPAMVKAFLVAIREKVE